MISSAPKFRSDLTVRRQETADGTSFVVKNPDSGEFFRFREVEQFLAQQLDGETSLDAVRRRTEETFDATLANETLYAFVKNLEKTGLLETEAGAKRKGESKRGRIRGSVLYLRFKVLDPTRLFVRLGPRVRFCFTPHFLVISAASILLAVGTTIANWDQFVRDLPRLYQLSSIPGQKVMLRTRAHPDQTFSGTVTSIATSAQGSSSSGSSSASGGQTATTSASSSASANKTILVTTEIDNSSLLLKPELTGQAKIFCGPRRIIDLITWRTARAFKVDVWSWW